MSKDKDKTNKVEVEQKTVSPSFSTKKQKPVKRPFDSLVDKNKIEPTEAAILKVSMEKFIDNNGLIDPETFDRKRKTIMGAPAGR